MYLQEFLNKKKKPAKAAATTAVAESSDDDSTKAGKVAKPVAAEGGDEDKLTTLNLKNDFTIDYSKYENVHNKLKEIHEERNKGRKNAKHHAELLAFMLEQAKDPKQRVDILLNLLNAIFAAAKISTQQGFLPREGWLNAHNHIITLLKLLEDPALM